MLQPTSKALKNKFPNFSTEAPVPLLNCKDPFQRSNHSYIASQRIQEKTHNYQILSTKDFLHFLLNLMPARIPVSRVSSHKWHVMESLRWLYWFTTKIDKWSSAHTRSQVIRNQSSYIHQVGSMDGLLWNETTKQFILFYFW